MKKKLIATCGGIIDFKPSVELVATYDNGIKSHKPTPPHVKNSRGKRKAWKK